MSIKIVRIRYLYPFTNLIIVPFGLIFQTSWMTLNAILKISNSLFPMLGLNVGGGVFVTAVAGIFNISALVTGLATDVSATFMV